MAYLGPIVAYPSGEACPPMSSVEPLTVPPGALTAPPLSHSTIPFVPETPQTVLMDRRECMCHHVPLVFGSWLTLGMSARYRQRNCLDDSPC